MMTADACLILPCSVLACMQGIATTGATNSSSHALRARAKIDPSGSARQAELTPVTCTIMAGGWIKVGSCLYGGLCTR